MSVKVVFELSYFLVAFGLLQDSRENGNGPFKFVGGTRRYALSFGLRFGFRLAPAIQKSNSQVNSTRRPVWRHVNNFLKRGDCLSVFEHLHLADADGIGS